MLGKKNSILEEPTFFSKKLNVVYIRKFTKLNFLINVNNDVAKREMFLETRFSLESGVKIFA